MPLLLRGLFFINTLAAKYFNGTLKDRKRAPINCLSCKYNAVFLLVLPIFITKHSQSVSLPQRS